MILSQCYDHAISKFCNASFHLELKSNSLQWPQLTPLPLSSYPTIFPSTIPVTLASSLLHKHQGTLLLLHWLLPLSGSSLRSLLSTSPSSLCKLLTSTMMCLPVDPLQFSICFLPCSLCSTTDSWFIYFFLCSYNLQSYCDLLISNVYCLFPGTPSKIWTPWG